MSSRFLVKGSHLFLHLNYNRALVPIPLGLVRQSLELFQLLVLLNREYNETFRGIIRGLVIGGDISQVRVIYGEGGLELWFPQIPHQTFMTTQNWDYSYFHENKFWMDYVDTSNEHRCPAIEYPKWYFNNIQTCCDINHQRNVQVSGSTIVETALEAWEALPFYSRVQIRLPEDCETLTEEEHERTKVLDESFITVEPPHLAKELYIEPDDVTKTCSEGNWLELPYVHSIILAINSRKMDRVLNTIQGVYPRVREILLDVKIMNLEDMLLTKILILFPRLDCVKMMFDPDSTPQDIFIKGQRIFGHLWHHSKYISS